MAVFYRKGTGSGVRGVSRFAGWLWIPGLAFAGDFWAWHWSFEHTSVANSTLLANVAILIVTLFAWLVWKERITRKFVTGAALAFCGVVVLMLSSKNRIPPTDGNPVFGDFLALTTAFSRFAISTISVNRYSPWTLLVSSAVSQVVNRLASATITPVFISLIWRCSSLASFSSTIRLS